jgi:hypothetical protein
MKSWKEGTPEAYFPMHVYKLKEYWYHSLYTAFYSGFFPVIIGNFSYQ